MKPLLKCILISFLWILWFLLLPCTFTAILVTGDSGWARFWWMSSAVLVLTAWINWGFHRKDFFARFAALIATGMTFGMLADLYGACAAIRFTDNSLTAIIPLFALGHVAYIWGMLDVAGRLKLTRRPGWKKVFAATVALYCMFGIALWVTLVHPSDDLPEMHLPTAVYTMFLSVSAGTMATVAIFDRRFLTMGIGGLLFLISDGFLGVRLFQDNWHGIGDLCWITYGIGQMLIVYGAVGAVWKLPCDLPQEVFEEENPE